MPPVHGPCRHGHRVHSNHPRDGTNLIGEPWLRCIRSIRQNRRPALSASVSWRKRRLDEDDRFRPAMVGHADPGRIYAEQRTLQTIDNPFGTRLSPMS